VVVGFEGAEDDDRPVERRLAEASDDFGFGIRRSRTNASTVPSSFDSASAPSAASRGSHCSSSDSHSVSVSRKTRSSAAMWTVVRSVGRSTGGSSPPASVEHVV